MDAVEKKRKRKKEKQGGPKGETAFNQIFVKGNSIRAIDYRSLEAISLLLLYYPFEI